VINENLLAGLDLHPGAALTRLGIEWLVIVPGSDFPPDILDRQVDLAARPVDSELSVYQNLSYPPGFPLPQQSFDSPVARTAGWGSAALLVVLSAAAYWGRNRRQPTPIEPVAPEPVAVA
jgi:hypothetical protein